MASIDPMDFIKKAAEKLVGAQNYYKETKWDAVNVTTKFMPSCISIPQKARKVFVYFMVPQPELNHYVSGHIMHELETILKADQLDYTHVFFLWEGTADRGIPPIASGQEFFNLYSQMDAGQLALLREKDNEHTYLACPEDVELLKLRLGILGDGGIVLTKKEMDAVKQKYIEAYKHTRLGEGTAIFQAYLDLAMSVAE